MRFRIRHFRALHLRLALRAALVSALFALIAGVGVYRWTYGQALHDGAQTLQALADAVERTAAIGAYANDPVLLQELADGLARNPLVGSARLSSAQHSVTGRRDGQPRPAPAQPSANSVQRPLTSPFDAAERVGGLRLDPDLQVLGAAANRQAMAMAALLALLTALVGWVVNVAAQRLVALPLRQLAAQLEALTPGTDERLAVPAGHHGDELGRLTASANRLLHSSQIALERERKLRAEVEAVEAQYRHIFDSSSAGIFVIHADGHLINANPTVFRLLGCSEAEWRSLPTPDFLDRAFAHPEAVRALIAESARTGHAASGDLALRTGNGDDTRWSHCIFSVQRSQEPTAPPREFVEGVLYDVTERRRLERAARHFADHDPLTGLLNRAGCASTVAAWRPGASDLGDEPYTALFIDLDGFKAVNDRLGHSSGDELLRLVADRLRACVRRSADLVSRNGGDEFVVVLRGLRGCDPAASKIAAQIGQMLQQPVRLASGETVRIGASIGMASFPAHGSDLPTVLHHADLAMYEVKRAGKNAFAMALLPA